MAQAIELVDKGGAIMIVGVAAGAVPVRLDLIQDRELALIGNLMYVREDYTAAIDLLPPVPFRSTRSSPPASTSNIPPRRSRRRRTRRT